MPPCPLAGSRPVGVLVRILKITNRACGLIQLSNTGEVLSTYKIVCATCCRATEMNREFTERLLCVRRFLPT